MLSSLRNLHQIVAEMEKTIGRSVNLTDNRGIIVASTQRTRIGMFHEGAARILHEQLNGFSHEKPDQLFEIEAAEEIGLPIVINGEMIGVVCIEGNKEDGAVYGVLIQKLTQVLVVDAMQKERHQLLDQTRQSFIYRWLLETPYEDNHTFAMRGKMLGIDVSLPRIAVVVDPRLKDSELEDNNEISSQKLNERMILWLQNEFRHNQNSLVVSVGSKCTVLYYGTSTAECNQTFTALFSRMEQEISCSAACGIGSVSRNLLEMQRSFREAEQACRVSLDNTPRRVRLFESLDIELLLQDITQNNSERFMSRLFHHCSHDEQMKWVNLLQVFFTHNSSIGKTAEALFIHKNTLQYRLKKLKQLTGYDPRNINEAMVLYLAVKLFNKKRLV